MRSPRGCASDLRLDELICSLVRIGGYASRRDDAPLGLLDVILRGGQTAKRPPQSQVRPRPLRTAYAYPKYYKDALCPELFHLHSGTIGTPSANATSNCPSDKGGVLSRSIALCSACDFEIGPAPHAAPEARTGTR